MIKPVAEKGGPSVTGTPNAGPTRLDALSALVTAAGEAAGKAKHVYVLKFFGDVTASQVAQLRQEVTAVLQTADVEGRGDEVVLVLNTGGGTVTGYGLAAAQLTRTHTQTGSVQPRRTVRRRALSDVCLPRARALSRVYYEYVDRPQAERPEAHDLRRAGRGLGRLPDGLRRR